MPPVDGTDAIVKCVTSDATVIYREYTSAEAMQLDVDYVNSTFNPTFASWHFGLVSNAPDEGTIYQYLDIFGDANLFWTVDSQNMSGGCRRKRRSNRVACLVDQRRWARSVILTIVLRSTHYASAVHVRLMSSTLIAPFVCSSYPAMRGLSDSD